MSNVTYYSFKDFIEALGLSYDSKPYAETTLTTFLTKIGTTYAISSPIPDNSYTQQVFKLVYRRYYNHAIIEIPEGESYDNNSYRDWLVNFFNIFNLTYDKYYELASYYNSLKTHLMDKIESENETRFNDTPMDGGSYSDDNHTTNITEFKTATDGGSKIERFAEINNKFVNVMTLWSNEFEKIFLEEEI